MGKEISCKAVAYIAPCLLKMKVSHVIARKGRGMGANEVAEVRIVESKGESIHWE